MSKGIISGARINMPIQDAQAVIPFMTFKELLHSDIRNEYPYRQALLNILNADNRQGMIELHRYLLSKEIHYCKPYWVNLKNINKFGIFFDYLVNAYTWIQQSKAKDKWDIIIKRVNELCIMKYYTVRPIIRSELLRDEIPRNIIRECLSNVHSEPSCPPFCNQTIKEKYSVEKVIAAVPITPEQAAMTEPPEVIQHVLVQEEDVFIQLIELLDSIIRNTDQDDMYKICKLHIKEIKNIWELNKDSASLQKYMRWENEEQKKHNTERKKQWLRKYGGLSYLLGNQPNDIMSIIISDLSHGLNDTDGWPDIEKDLETFRESFIDAWDKTVNRLDGFGIQKVNIVPGVTVVSEKDMIHGWQVSNPDRIIAKTEKDHYKVYMIERCGIEVDRELYQRPVVCVAQYCW